MNNDIFNDIDYDFDKKFDNTEGLMNNKIHLKVVQRTGRKYITIIEDLDISLHKQFIKKCKKSFSTNGWVSDNNVFLNGDHRDKVKLLLIDKYNIEEDNIYIHGF